MNEKIKIVSNDHLIELTPEEYRIVYEQRDHEYMKEDVESIIDEVVESTECAAKIRNHLDIIAYLAKDFLDSNEAFWDIYWEAIKDAIKEIEKSIMKG